MAGISSKASGSLENKVKFNGGNELQYGEFSDGSGLEMYDAKNRMYDPQVPHFGQIDPMADMSPGKSPYSFASNNPISINDPLGLTDSLPKVTVVGYISQKWNQFSAWFTGANVGYTGSGWGHGPRQWMLGMSGLGNNASNLFQLGLQSQFQNSHVNLTGGLLSQLKADPAMKAFQGKIIAILKADPRFGKVAFVSTGKEVIGFGGQRWTSGTERWGSLSTDNPLAHSETWAVAGNALTWAVRNAGVDYSATVKDDGTMVISYHLSDRFDLSAQHGRSEAYNNISAATGFLYHDVAGGNSSLQVSADWQATIK
jgi:RHS repeat-associated protein